MAFLPAERRTRLERLRQPQRRQEILCAYGLLSEMLRIHCGWNVLPEIQRTLHGKPWFLTHPEVQFSISHTDGAVLAAISEEPVGADIQRLRPLSERMLQLTDGNSSEEFWRSWVRREALAKRDGIGGPEVLRRQERALLPGETCRQLHLAEGYAAAAAYAGELAPVHMLDQNTLPCL